MQGGFVRVATRRSRHREHRENGGAAQLQPGSSNGHLILDLRSDLDIELVSISGRGLVGASPVQRAAKRVIDMVTAVLALVALSPLFVVIAVAIKLTSRGPVLYVSDRVGRNGRVFRFFKFRTMTVDADEVKPLLVDLNDVDGPAFKVKGDPRMTRLGRLLRRFSLDELPQFYHVLRGEMSLVGPRPPIPEEVVQYTDHQLQRLTVKPGLTCLWQVSGRSTLDFDTWVELDLRYIENWSLRYDLALLARTVPAVLSGRGAY